MGLLDSLIYGSRQPAQPGMLSMLGGGNLPPTWGPGYSLNLSGEGMSPGSSTIRLGSPTGGLAPGNGQGDAPRVPSILPTSPAPAGSSDDDDDSTAPAAHPGFFQAGGTLSKLAPILGAIGDALAVQGGGQPMYSMLMKNQQSIQDAELERQYKRAQIAHLNAPDTPKVGPLQQKVNDLRANGATDADIHSLILNETNPFQAVPGHDEQGRPTLTMVRPNQIGGIPSLAPPATADPSSDLPVGTIVNGHRYMGGGTGNQANWQAMGGAPSQGGATFSPSAAYDAVIQQESGGRAGVTGPVTPYGRAQGMSQMLPATAQSMAAKIGVPWVPSMMTGTTPDAANYQRQLGQAYFDEGLTKTGNVFDAARYYFAGPNRALWGAKTRAYADNIVARLGGQ